MKKIATIFTLILFSQMGQSQSTNDSYSSLWQRVQKLENEAMTKSALDIVTLISKKAKKEQNSVQIIRSLLYTSKYALNLEEDAQLKIVRDFKKEIDQSQFPTKNILEGYLANMYWQYFQQNRYQFYDRTTTEEKVDSIDFRTWDLSTIFHEISVHFDASLQKPLELQQLKVDAYKEILNEQKGSQIYRPTLFDLLAHSALNFYKTSENSITRPADKFELDNPEILCEGKQFVEQQISTRDKTSLQSRALMLYQQLLDFHKPKDEAYVDMDIERLRYIKENAVFPNKDQQYLEVLQNTAESIKNNKNSALYQYEIAMLYREWGNSYQPNIKDEHRWKQKEAMALCESVIEQFPNSRGAEKCKALKSEILSRDLQLTGERHVPVNLPSRLLVEYKNLHTLQLSARKISQKEIKQLNSLYPEEKVLAFIKKLTEVKSWDTKLINENDHQSHKIEILLPELSNGSYIILATPYADSENTFAYSPIQVTNLALVEGQTSTDHNFQVIDRNSGKPISGATLKFSYQQNYERPILTKTLVSDEKGLVTLPLSSERWNNVDILIGTKNEEAFFEDFYVNAKYDQGEEDNLYSCFLFTDRSIYRPGQPLYFKGLAMVQKDDKSSVLTNTKLTVSLMDVNHQEVAQQEFRTNDYGSISGTFILPNNRLTGNYYLKLDSEEVDISGNSYFSVEEYKRPKFETSLESITETYRVNDTISVKGTAKAYAGSLITGAKVSYTVRRVVYYPKWYYWHLPYFDGTPQEIAHGETVTDANGKYEINFKAIPDLSIAKENMPTFNYEVTADVTDLNGETHSATTMVNVGYHALTADIQIDDPLNKDGKNPKITISSYNLNGEFVAAQGSLKMYKLKAPNNVLRPRPWAAPDYDGFGKTKFKELFPHDAFGKEDNPAFWEKGELVWKSSFDTGKSKEIDMGNVKKWLSGKYVIELETKDKFGQLVKDITQTTFYSDKDKLPADNQLFQIKTDKNSYAIGEKAKLTLRSAAEDLTISLFIEKDRKIVETHLIELHNNSKTIEIPVTADDLGGFAINYSFSAYNAFQSGSLSITVPYPSSELEIETITFRDKLQPGKEETWSFNIKGPKGDKVTAELLASMYDASLDAFKGHHWNFSPNYRGQYYSHRHLNAYKSYGITSFNTYLNFGDRFSYDPQDYDSFDWFGFHFGYSYALYDRMVMKSSAPGIQRAELAESESLEETAVTGSAAPAPENKGNNNPIAPIENDNKNSFDDIQYRKNLQETAFFFPQLLTDKDGNVSFSFTTPEALTKWKLQLLAHTKSMESATSTLETVTQKELMVTPNAPRFLSEGDKITISTKIANLTNKLLSGNARLELADAFSGKDITRELLISDPLSGTVMPENTFTVDAMGNTQVSWNLKIPEGIGAVQYKVMAKAGNFSDGEQNVLPVLSNRMLVTETLPMWVRGNETKTFTLDKLKNTTSTTLKHHQLSLEITSNPAWYAVQALPYLMEYPYDCNEQIFSRYYANTLGGYIANSNPRIQQVFNQWANSDALLSNLEKNEELKSILIQETPWLRDAQSETEQKKRIALLFDLNKLKNDQDNAFNKLVQNQMSSGAWAWFKGGPENRFITQHIVTGLGHLKKLIPPSGSEEKSGIGKNSNTKEQQVIKNAVAFLDDEFVKEYEQMKKYATDLNNDHLSHTQIHYMYMRSYFPDIKVSKKVAEIMDYYTSQVQKYWVKRDLYSKGLLSLILHRNGNTATANKIIKSLEENSILSDELGMYWKENSNSWYWYQAPIETQSLLIEAFSEIKDDIKTVDNLKIWLLKNKQTNQWKTTKATTDAVYALLLRGSEWLSVTEAVDVLVGGKKIEPSKLENVQVEAGTGYYKTSWSKNEISPKMAEVQLNKKGDGIAWGALYWQYFEDLDKITPADTPLKLKKKVFLKKNTDTGEVLSEINGKTALHVGDLVRIRIELRADRPMEFVHMKDMRAAGMEPINVLSSYKWQDGLGYYESTKDASTNFFFDYLPKGIFVFEYDLRVNNAGDFSNGISTIQSMYAPEFSSHSEGVRILIE
ncbi:alpha-2-macroglobulin family protein [Arenibacter sp. S6351L]|uniref:alpha-2-macroglobulin family protein n=1 Tax=Arenibacter sp. S6351L TaxID=2926407 RepID=UPI001FF514E0|nr:alpha-2-macroglobulin family protein [Arenibacter sp. S6351L]MCK0136519.1 MG2 domain-containing protein [Arenibacter sp. S6351L]